MKPKTPAADRLFRGTTGLKTLGQWLQWAEGAYERHGLAFGQITDNAHDDALFLLLRALDLPVDSPGSVLKRKLTNDEVELLKTLLRRRILERVPAAYLAREAVLGGLTFYVDERVIIPRSYFVELIPQFDALVGDCEKVRRVVDVCTGSGCLAILLAHHFPNAEVDAIDLSPDALAVARENVRLHHAGQRVHLHQSDVFEAVPRQTYDLILSNPPYEPTDHCAELPPEFRHEPALALDGGSDGLDIIRRLLAQATDRLTKKGLVVIEVGGLRAAMEAAFPRLPIEWLPTADGTNCVCAIHARDLRRGLV